MRNPTFDILKGIAIILVIIGHQGLFIADQFIYSFHMPLFFIVSGYFFNVEQYRNRGGIKKDFQRLLVPYIVSQAIILAFTGLRSIAKRDIYIFSHRLFSQFWVTPCVMNIPLPHNFFLQQQFVGEGPVWFLIALFWMRLFYSFVDKLGKYSLPICVLLSICSIKLFRILPVPFCILQATGLMIFLAIGNWVRNHQLKIWMVLSLIPFWIWSLFINHIDVYWLSFSNYAVQLLGALGGTAVMYYLSKLIEGKTVYISRFFQWFGKNSMIVLCFHSIDIFCCWVSMLFNGIFNLVCSSITIAYIRNIIVVLFSWIGSKINICQKIFGGGNLLKPSITHI